MEKVSTYVLKFFFKKTVKFSRFTESDPCFEIQLHIYQPNGNVSKLYNVSLKFQNLSLIFPENNNNNRKNVAFRLHTGNVIPTTHRLNFSPKDPITETETF